jgi:hypothetical protein
VPRYNGRLYGLAAKVHSWQRPCECFSLSHPKGSGGLLVLLSDRCSIVYADDCSLERSGFHPSEDSVIIFALSD